MKSNTEIANSLIHSYRNGYTVHLQTIANKYKHLGYEKKVEMAKSASVIECILTLLGENKTGEVYREFEKLVIEGVIVVNILKTLNYNNFRRQITNWRREGFEKSVKLKNVKNTNAAKFKDDKELLAWVYWLRFDTRNLSGEAIKRIISWNCNLNNKQVPSHSWIADKLKDGHLKALAAAKRWSKGNRNRQGYESVLHGLRCPMANDRWEMDGTRVNLLPFRHNGKDVFLYGVWVTDNHSGDILGWEFSTSENPENRWMYVNALKMAVNRTGAFPRELAFDRFPGNKTDEIDRLLKKIHSLGCEPIVNYRAEGKQHHERGIGTFQTVILSQSDYYYGQGVKATTQAAHTTTEYQKQMQKQIHKLGIGFEQMCKEAERFIEQYRTTKLTEYGRQNANRLPYSPSEIWQLSEKHNQITIDPWQIADLFWLEKPLKMTNQRCFVTEIVGEKCVYYVEDYEMLVKLEREPKALIRYDENDLNEIYVFTLETNELLGVLKRHELTVTRGKMANGKAVGHYKKTQKVIEDKRNAEITEVLSVIEDKKPIPYWGKEAKIKFEEQQLVEDVFDLDLTFN